MTQRSQEMDEGERRARQAIERAADTRPVRDGQRIAEALERIAVRLLALQALLPPPRLQATGCWHLEGDRMVWRSHLVGPEPPNVRKSDTVEKE